MSKSKLQAGLFLLPAALVFIVFYYWPLLENIYLSFFQWNMISPNMKYVGLNNYTDIFSATEFGKIFFNSVVYIVLLVIFNFLLPYIYSYMLGHLVSSGQSFYRFVLFMPSTISLSVAAIIFLWIFNPLAGPISMVLEMFGLESPRWFKDSSLVILAISTIIGWKVFGYNLIVMLAAMVAVPRELLEAARLENASNWTIFRKIIIPMTSSTALYVFTITVVFGLQYVLVPVNMLTQGGPDQHSSNMVYVVYQYAFTFFQTGKSAAFAVSTMAIYALFLFAKNKFLDKQVHYEN